MMLDIRAWEGVNSLLDNYAEAQQDDTFVVAYTPESHECAAWVLTCLELRGIEARRVPMSPLRDDGFAERLSSVLPLPTGLPGRLVVLTLERDTMSHNDIIRNSISKYDPAKCVVFRAISASHSLFADALSALPCELSARNTAILERCMKARNLRIEAPGGTKLSVTLDNEQYSWISNRGVWRKGTFVMLPAGEVATYPASIDGILVADFAFNVNFITDKDARLHDNPVKVWIEGGKAIGYECNNKDMKNFLDDCFKTHCVYNVGEIGFGTNFAVDAAIPLNSHINERRPGVHLGFGDHNQKSNVVKYNCPIHVDLIAKGGFIWVDGNTDPIDLVNLEGSLQPHPSRYNAEDLKSPESDKLEIDDCCGMGNRDGLQLFEES